MLPRRSRRGAAAPCGPGRPAGRTSAPSGVRRRRFSRSCKLSVPALEPLRANLIRWARSTRAAAPGPLRTAWAATFHMFDEAGSARRPAETPCRGRLAVRGRSRTCRGRGVPGTTRAALARALSQYYLARNLVAAPRRRRLLRALPCGQPSSFTHALPLHGFVPLYGA